MELTELYNKAVLLIEEVKNVSSQTAENSGLCVITSNSGKLYAGVGGLKIVDGAVSEATPEYNAVLSMLADGNTLAEKIISISSDGSVRNPSEDCIEMLMNANSENVLCEVAISSDKSVKICELSNQKSTEETAEHEEVAEHEETVETAEPEIPPVPVHEQPFISETFEFSEEPVSDNMSFEEKFGFDFDDAPVTPVPTLADELQNDVTAQPENAPVQQTVQNSMQQPYQDGMSGQFVNMPVYQQPVQQGYPQQQVYPNQTPQGMVGQFIQPTPQYTQSGQQIFTPQPSLQSGQQVYGQPMNQGYPQQYGQPMSQPMSQPISQPISQPVQSNLYTNSQPLQNVYPHQQATPVSSHYMNSGVTVSSSSQSVTLSGEGKSKFRQRLSKFMEDDMPAPKVPQTPTTEENLSKGEIRRQARDKKKMAKVNADFKKRMKDLGY